MKKVCFMLSALVLVFGLSACCNCDREPIVEQNQKLIVPPNFGNQPK